MQSRRLATLSLLVLAAGCSFPRFSAERVVERAIPLGQDIHFLRCETHNGNVSVRSTPGLDELRMRVTLEVRGRTQAEADENLDLMSVRHERVDGGLVLAHAYDRTRLADMSPCFSFELEGPPELALELTSHNGNLDAAGTAGDVRLETHNGNVGLTTRARQVFLTTHNGNVTAAVDGDGPLGGSIRTHNGNVSLWLRGAVDCVLEADTHNGTIRLDREARVTSGSRTHLECRLGSGERRVSLESHNGDIVIR